MNNELLNSFNYIYDNAYYPVILCNNEFSVIKTNKFADKNCKQLICENSLLKTFVSPNRYMAVVKLRNNDFFEAVLKSPDNTLYSASICKSGNYMNCAIVTLRPYKNLNDVSKHKTDSDKILPLLYEKNKTLLKNLFEYAFKLDNPATYSKFDNDNVTVGLITELHEALRTTMNTSALSDFNAKNILGNDKPMNINRFMNTIFQEISQYLEIMDVEFKFSIKTNDIMIDIVSYIDPKLLALMIDNIVSNALKFHTPGSKIKAKLTEKDSYYAISVQNQGKLLAKSESAHIFDPFYSVDSSCKSFGLGIGLTVTRLIAEQLYCGECKFSSTAKYGNVCTLKLPIIGPNKKKLSNKPIDAYNNDYVYYTDYLKHLLQLYFE